MDRHSFATVVVGPRALYREGLARILGAADFFLVATAASVDELAAAQFTKGQAILLVLSMSGDHDATVRQVGLFRERHPAARVAFLADDDPLCEHTVVAALRAGADAYLLTPSGDTLIKSLELVMLGETILSPPVLSFVLRHLGEGVASEGEMSADVPRVTAAYARALSTYSRRLTAREQCILRCLIKGGSNKAIARQNEMAEATVKVHIKAILRKIGVNNRTQAAVWAMNRDLGLTSGSAPATTWTADLSSRRGAVAARPKAQRNGVAHSHESSQVATAHDPIRLTEH